MDATPIIYRLRQIKTAYEQKVLRRSVEISAEAHVEGMRPRARALGIRGRSGDRVLVSEEWRDVVGLSVDRRQRSERDGAALSRVAAARCRTAICCWSTPRRTIQGLTGDITRTYPVNGKFTQAQRDIYELVLEAQDAGLSRASAAAADGCHGGDAYGLRARALAARAHHRGRPDRRRLTGRDVERPRPDAWHRHRRPRSARNVRARHGVRDRARPLHPSRHARQPAEDARERGVHREGPCRRCERYKHIGVRIEDSYLFTESGLERLSERVPRTVAEIEQFLRPDSSARR